MTDATAPRRWFQIHLSTMVVLVLLAGVVVAFNAKPKRYFLIRAAHHNFYSISIVSSYGWPIKFCDLYRSVPGIDFDRDFEDFQKSLNGDMNNPAALDQWGMKASSKWYTYFNMFGLGFDFGLLLTVLIPVALLCELWIRRRT